MKKQPTKSTKKPTTKLLKPDGTPADEQSVMGSRDKRPQINEQEKHVFVTSRKRISMGIAEGSNIAYLTIPLSAVTPEETKRALMDFLELVLVTMDELQRFRKKFAKQSNLTKGVKEFIGKINPFGKDGPVGSA